MSSKKRSPVQAGGPLTTIIIPVFNNLELTRNCLESLLENTDGRYEVLVVDNGSTDETPRYLESVPVHVLRMDENLGFPPAVNAGIRQAQGEYVCLLNNDTVLLPGWLPPLVKHLEKNPKAALAGPMQVGEDGRIVNAGVVFSPDAAYGLLHRQPFHIYLSFPSRHPTANVARSYPAINFGCAVIKRGLFEEVGPLDEDTFTFPGNYEDVDWCLRVRKAGYTCDFRPRSRIVHACSRTQAGLGEDFKVRCIEGAGENLVRFLAKWRDEPEDLFVPPATRLLTDEYWRDVRRAQEKSAAEATGAVEALIDASLPVSLDRMDSLQSLINHLESHLGEPDSGVSQAYAELLSGEGSGSTPIIDRLRSITAGLNGIGCLEAALPFSRLLELVFPHSADVMADREFLASNAERALSLDPGDARARQLVELARSCMQTQPGLTTPGEPQGEDHASSERAVGG